MRCDIATKKTRKSATESKATEPKGDDLTIDKSAEKSPDKSSDKAASKALTKATARAVDKSAEQEAKAQAFAISAARLCAATRCSNVLVLDVRGISPITDFFVISTGTSERQMRSVSEEVEDLGKPDGFKCHSRAIDPQWILIDCIDVVIHFFTQDARMFYDLETLWGDAKLIDWKPKT